MRMRAASNTYAEEVMHGFWKRRPGRRPRRTARARRWRRCPGAWRYRMTAGSELADIPQGLIPMAYEMPLVQSDVVGRGTGGRSPRGTLEQRLAGTQTNSLRKT